MSFWTWLTGRGGETQSTPDVQCEALYECAEECSARKIAFDVCVNMIANAVGKCEFKTYKNNRPAKDAEYFLWNVEPNINQNSSEFLHELICKLLKHNEALVIEVKQRGEKKLVCADSWTADPHEVRNEKTYSGVTVGGFTYSKPFREADVLHFRLNNDNVKKVLDLLAGSYGKMLDAAKSAYEWNAGHHLKVHVNQIASGVDDFQKKFADMMAQQTKPWIQNPNAVLPEFDGYEYSDMGGQKSDTRDIRAVYSDIFDFTAQAFGIPPVLLTGTVADSKDAMTRWLTECIDPLCYQIEEEIIRKRYGIEAWKNGDFLSIDTSTILHFDLFQNAANIEKLIGSGCYSINDVIVAGGQPAMPYEWADKHWLTLNIGTIEATARSTDGKGETNGI